MMGIHGSGSFHVSASKYKHDKAGRSIAFYVTSCFGRREKIKE
jgi:hypothetical protein